MEEIWKEIPNYDGIYHVSNFGNVVCFRNKKKRFLSLRLSNSGYLRTTLHYKGTRKTFQVHQLVAMTFLNHKPNGNTFVVNHKDFNKQNNNVGNLEIVTNRENSNRLHLKSSSRYVGVDYHKKDRKWRARIVIDKKSVYLGMFNSEIEAKNAYQSKLKEISNNKTQAL
jgi:hypothetical protein